MNQFTWKEDLDRRVFAAVRFVNAVDRTPISTPMEIRTAPAAKGAPANPSDFLPLRILRNRAGLHVIHSGTTPFPSPVAQDLASYISTFDPAPTLPAVEILTARLRAVDPSGKFLPRDFTLKLPRQPAGRDPEHSVAAPLPVAMFPSPAAATSEDWAVLRVMVWRLVAAPTADNPAKVKALPVPGALVRVLGDKPATPLAQLDVLGRGLTEWRPRADGDPVNCAEALVAVRDILMTSWSSASDGPVVTEVQSVRLEVRFDPKFDPNDATTLPDPDTLDRGDASFVSGALPDVLKLRAHDRSSLRVAFDLNKNLIPFPPN